MEFTKSPTGPLLCTPRVTTNEFLCREHLRLTVQVPTFPPAAPGQFVQIGPHTSPGQSAGVAGATRPFLRRAFSISGLWRRPGECTIEFVYRVVGPGTSWMSQLREGDSIDVLGPLGNTLPVPQDGGCAWLVAGGVGLAPLLWFAREAAEVGRSAVLFFGARSADLIPLATSEHGGQAHLAGMPDVPVVLATDDGSIGSAGTVVDALAQYADRPGGTVGDVTVYTCGPEAMLKGVAEFCARREIRCYVCAERAMACGIGACQSCVLPVRDTDDPDGWRYALCCTEGPVFDAGRILWERPGLK